MVVANRACFRPSCVVASIASLLPDGEHRLPLGSRNLPRQLRCSSWGGQGQQEKAMQRTTLIVFLSLIAAACVACDSKPGPGPSPTPPARFSVHQIDSVPGDGGTLAYGQAGKVLVQYTVQSGLQVPPNGPYGPIHLPPEAMMPIVYRVASCLSADGATCLTDGGGQTVAGDGSVWNSVALNESFRGRLDQTGYMIHELRMTRGGAFQTSEVVAREVGHVRWHFQ
jgi:hypothetical protein